MADFDLNRIRREIPALEKSIYLNTGGVGPLHDGDVVECEVPGVGCLRNRLIDPR